MRNAERKFLKSLSSGLLQGSVATSIDVDSLDEDALLAELGADQAEEADGDIAVLRHVRSSTEIRAAEELADRKPCEDFARSQPLFEKAERELKAGVSRALRLRRDASVEVGDFFILGGQLAYVVSMGEQYRTTRTSLESTIGRRLADAEV
jgi:hypothetical protein